ncbi:MAG: OmpH family outer membrane protein [Fimbriimonadaceae bacterium]|nr:OmpH family outer membrane protein [Fimbriimonadaceae bacterium]
MKTDKLTKLGWIAAIALVTVWVGSGFQEGANKIAVVDIAKVVEQSNHGKANQDAFAKMKKAREDLLQFIDDNRVLTNEQAQDLRNLWLKDNATAEEKSKVDRIKADVVASNKKWTELGQKPNLTPEDRTLLDEYAKRGQNMEVVARKWYGDFTNEMQAWADKQKVTSIEKARTAIQTVAKQQGFTIVFEIGIAPYGANDLTAPALQAMNASP